MKYITFIIFTTVLISYLLFTRVSFAAENWIIDNFQSQINLQKNGKVQVSEVIDVDFRNLVKHGIYRDIPYIYQTDKGGRIYTDIEVQSVLQDGVVANYQFSKTGNFLRLKIGDPNRTISYKHTYQIKYLATGVLRSFEDHDELNWDVTGNGWPVPINNVSAIGILPDGLIKATCYQGIIGVKNTCNMRLFPPTRVLFNTTNSLQVSEGLTIVVGYKKGLVPILGVTPSINLNNSNQQIEYQPNGWVFLISTIFGIGLVFLWWKKKGQEQSLGSIMVEYNPPEDLRPAGVGTLLDERADTLDVSATIVDLAARGFLTIEEKEKKWLFGSTDFIFTRKSKEDSNLLQYEKYLLNNLFKEDDVVKMSELKNEFFDELAEVKQKLYKDVVDKKYFPTNPENVKARYTALGIIVLFISVITIIKGIFESTGIISGFGLGLLVTSCFLILFSRTFTKRTVKGNQTFKKILGFKLFMEKVEVYKQRYMEKENLFNELLPYAIVFGITEKFAQAFKDLGLKPEQPNWYISNKPYNPILFSSHVDNFSSSLTSAISSQPSTRNSFVSSGSGFSSGSSGGGFGGGGGGSW